MFLWFLFICRYYLKCYIFVSQLEALNIPYTVQSFLSSPKEGLVKGLWKNHSHEPQVLSHRQHSNYPSLFPRFYFIGLEMSDTKPEAPFILSGCAVGGRPVPGVPDLRPSAVEQPASEAARLQPGENVHHAFIQRPKKQVA